MSKVQEASWLLYERLARGAWGGAALATGESSVLVSGADFYSSPRLSLDGSRLAWVRVRYQRNSG